ncbi:MAG: protein translocase subunit SecD [Armatimonadota bacterium]|nr:protein translocase subunit SecD [Armatimonadota bacterium]
MSKYQRLFLIILGVAVVAAYFDFAPKSWPLARPMKRGLDLAGGMRVVLQARSVQGKEITKDDLNAAVLTVHRRVDSLGVSEPIVHPKGRDQIVVELPEIRDKAHALELLQKTGSLEFYHLKNVNDTQGRGRNKFARWLMSVSDDNVYSFTDTRKPGSQPISDPKEIKKLVIGENTKPILTGRDLVPGKTAVQLGNQGTSEVVALVFSKPAQQIFAQFTRLNVHEFLAITLDDVILTAPRINEAIPGNPIIEGNFTPSEAQELVDLLNAGALPVPLDVAQVQTVEATLGRESVQQSLFAGVIGLGLVLLFMLLYYRLPGVIANIALGLYALFTFAAFKGIGVTMTLPGLAGFILSIGMAVDANILIFERLKEELKSGKTLRAAIDAGFSRAFTSIFDSNMCTLITCGILYGYGTGPVRGFAITLAIGVLISMFTAITVTRTILHLLVGAEWAQSESAGRRLFGLGDSWIARRGRHFDIIGKRAYYFIFSTLVIIPGLIFWYSGGLKKSIEFTGGSSLTVTFEQPVNSDRIVSAMEAIGYPGSQALISQQKQGGRERYMAFIRMKRLNVPENVPSEKAAAARTAEQQRVQNELQKRIGEFEIQEYSEVGPTVSKELTTKAIVAVALASIAIVMYLSFRFAIGGFLNGLKFGTCAVIALIHDVLVVLGASAIFGHFFGWEIDSLFVTALLTVIGFSVHDTIVVFDRIRENLKHRMRGESFEQLANRSILQTFARSVNTSFTVVLTLLALLLFGGPVIKHFIAALLVGIISGTYSSIFNATPLVVVWENLSGDKGASRRAVQDRPLVTGERVKELRPVAEREVESEEQEPVTATQWNKAKPKAKKKKRRY